MRRNRLAASLLAATMLLAACRADESLKPPPAPPVPSGGALFQRYVSLGNSITAGFQSAGINDSTQRRSYAVLLAAGMGTQFVYPALLGRGCPPPFINNVTQARLGGGTGGTCDLRATNSVPGNLAVPGARVTELLSNFGVPVSSSNALTMLFLGGKTQVQRLMELHPTFVTVWIGNNDVLGSLTSQSNPGNPALITPLATFTAQYDSLLDSIEVTGASAALVSVGNVSVIPYASAAAIWYCLKNGGCPPPLPPQNATLAGIPTFTVNANCAPPGGLQILVPWTIGLTKVSTAAGGTAATIDCSVDNEVVTSAELNGLVTAVNEFNAHIQAEAQARGMAYLDINLPLGALRANGTIPAFPDISGALGGGSVLFGPIFTLDGVHPSSTAHQLIADSLASIINQTFGTTLPVPVCATVTCPTP